MVTEYRDPYRDALHLMTRSAESSKRRAETADTLHHLVYLARRALRHNAEHHPQRVGPPITVAALREILERLPQDLPVEVEIPERTADQVAWSDDVAFEPVAELDGVTIGPYGTARLKIGPMSW